MSHPGATASDRHKVVIIGSGFGGLTAAKTLKRADVDVKLIARTTHHLFQPLLYQVATGIISEGEIALGHPSDPAQAEERSGAAGRRHPHRSGEPDGGFGAARAHLFHAVRQPHHRRGRGQSYFGNDHFAEFAPGMKSIDDALELRGRILGAFEQAERSSDPVRRAKLLTFTVVGAGPTGVEMAGQIAELADQTLRGSFRHIDPTEARVILLDAAPAVLPPMGEKLGKRAQARLEKMGVEVQLGAMVTDVDRNGLTVKDSDGTLRRIESACKVWSAGVSASPLGKDLAEQSGVELDRAGRVKVQPDLTLPGHPNVFVVGDMAAVDGVPGVAQGAIQGGRYAAKLIKREVSRHQPEDPVPVRVLRQGLDGHGVAVLRGGQGRPGRVLRVLCLAVLAGAAPGVHRRVQEPAGDGAVVDGDVPEHQARAAHDHRAAGLRAHQNRRTRGDRGFRAGNRESGFLRPLHPVLSEVAAGHPARWPGCRRGPAPARFR